MVVLVTLGLAVLLAGLAGKLKLMHTSVQEKNDLINTTLRELEEYKRKALDKQTKLSRELQNERNKVMELRRT